jgi:hypothetical protein
MPSYHPRIVLAAPTPVYTHPQCVQRIAIERSQVPSAPASASWFIGKTTCNGFSALHPAGQTLRFWPLGPLGIPLPLRLAIDPNFAVRYDLLSGRRINFTRDRAYVQ